MNWEVRGTCVGDGGLGSMKESKGIEGVSHSVMSDALGPSVLQPTRLPCPWDSPGKNTGVGCHFLLPCMKVKSESEVTQSCPTLSDLMDCSLRGSSIHGIFQARVLEWGAINKEATCKLGRESSSRTESASTSMLDFLAPRMCINAKLLQWCLTLCNSLDCSLLGSLSMGFSRQEY